MIEQRKIELMAPAKNLECGIEAINHGADAVYIGAPKFGARAAAGNSLQDIAVLVAHAHLYHARVYVTINTILKEEELEEAARMIGELYRIRVDALIVQDMALLQMNLPPIPLHASTQTDNRTSAKVAFLAKAGFEQIVLARELSLQQIQEIKESCPSVVLEAFVHGALCVSYSGQCYVSQACFKRSANRGECAQFCRMAFNLTDADGKIIAANKHLLSLKDLNRSDSLEALLDAGVDSLKIEGRLKDVSYVKNITAYYRQKLDEIIHRRPEYIRASSGTCRYTFTPCPEKSFNRGFTSYFLYGRHSDLSCSDTPKSLGEKMGTVKEIRKNYFTVAGVKPFHNGDGVCFLDEKGTLRGFRINRVEDNKLFPQEMPAIKPHTLLYRNYDQAFERLLTQKTSERKISVRISLQENRFGYTLSLTDEDDNSVSLSLAYKKEFARQPQEKILRSLLSKLGNTPFEADEIKIDCSGNRFIPASVLTELRRQAINKLMTLRRINYQQHSVKRIPTAHPFPENRLTYRGNVSNSYAAAFYRNHGVKSIEPAYEQEAPADAVVMFCKHCLRYSMGWCSVRQKVQSPYREPYFLVTNNGMKFRLEFDCRNCEMKISTCDTKTSSTVETLANEKKT